MHLNMGLILWKINQNNNQTPVAVENIHFAIRDGRELLCGVTQLPAPAEW